MSPGRRMGCLVGAMLVVTAAGCGPDRTQAEFPEMSFSVDSTRLGERFMAPGAGLTLRVPADWISAPAETLTEAMRRVGQDEALESDEPRLRALYRDPSSGAALAVSEYVGPGSPDRRDRLAALQERGLRAQDREADVKSGRFSLHGLNVVQIRVVRSDQVIFKLLAARPPKPIFQLDYVLPRDQYLTQLRAVESSIGSLESR